MDGGDVDDINDRIEKLKKQAAELSAGGMVSGFGPGCTPEIQEQFWKNVLAFENAPEVAPFDELLHSGLALPPPDELDDAALLRKLWEIIRGLEDLGVYLEFTNHLSDRQLYAILWSRVLHQPLPLTPDDGDAAWHMGVSASGGDDDGVDVYLTYYADEDDRRRWADDFPDDQLPEPKPL